ncbi:hypothetical protein A2716_01125 [candidate division WWE3 bacterium RIFCSPHIGHO2_01_FULL_40_23]|uniref:ATP-grasp domain-containing protein n=1 Tax=candidate division WWE3 bacterium RIFCSPLOWO2_01_FULL_41_18 TaxID=1802625 RepID=A0A1F4VDI4_UNCKA|nr:MAG: hypothetical protein A2716_01125 [candidate division WWE3 bacterium RIFCSPHIGHO2_01_FULL_40_23]OGC55342.1 MAG: hypothetical protein A3A78_00030 [candidate division WWE3 bacterium RIFCSPLOWO2_01_FULL_41_18]
MNIKKVAVLYNIVSEIKRGNEIEKLADDDNLNSARDVSRSLNELGYDVTLYEVSCKTLQLLDNIKTDLIFNLLEGFENIPSTYAQITSYIEAINVPITGSTSFSGYLTVDKARTKDYLLKNKIPTPNYQLFISEDDQLKYNLRYPLITKPNTGDASVGITQDSVVKNFNELRERILIIKNEYKDATLAEEYIYGRELEAFAVNTGEETLILPILEGLFIPDESRKWDICDFDHKWGPKSYCEEECPANVSQEVTENINQIVRDTQRIFDIKGYFRLDLRLSQENIPYVVEVNTNPGFDESVLESKLKAYGITYNDLVQMVMDSAAYEFENKYSSQKSFSKSSDLIQL